MLFKIADLVFCLDFNTPSRVGEMEKVLVSSPAKKVHIDHHLKPDLAADLVVSHPEASSTCELVFRIVWQMGAFPQLDKAFAVPVYCGMMTDTGGFTFNSNRPEIFVIISELLTKHIDKAILLISQMCRLVICGRPTCPLSRLVCRTERFVR